MPPKQMRQQSAAEAADLEEVFCLSWERWSEELVASVARHQPWPLPPQLTPHVNPALLRLAEAAMNALAAVWGCDVECKRLAQQVDELQRSKGHPHGSAPSGSLALHEQQELAKALLNEEQEVRRLREREQALSEQLAASRASCRKLKEREANVSQLEVEQKAQLVTAKRLEATAKQQFQDVADREAELQALRLQNEEILAQAAKKDAVQASLSQELRKTKQQLLQSEQQKQKLLTSLQEYLSGMEHKFDAARDDRYDRYSPRSSKSRSESPTRWGKGNSSYNPLYDQQPILLITFGMSFYRSISCHMCCLVPHGHTAPPQVADLMLAWSVSNSGNLRNKAGTAAAEIGPLCRLCVHRWPSGSPIATRRTSEYERMVGRG
eukprot:symbB.v1.2.008756.t1/scaffold544.1/size189386/13